jgi:ribosomal protein S18 acetylase RimI-like enzyme
MRLADVTRPRPALELAAADWREHLRLIGVAPDLLSGLDPATLQLVVARRGGENVGTGFGFDHDGDCGIYNVGTLEHARRQGVGSAVTSVLVHDAIGRGCRTASLQSTPMAERMYAAAGFRDLGRIIEYVPAQTSCGLTSRQPAVAQAVRACGSTTSLPIASLAAMRRCASIVCSSG